MGVAKVRSFIGRYLFQCVDFFLYVKHKILRSNYAKYYAERMDRRIKRNHKWGLSQDKSFQLDYLISHGLDSTSKLLDYGAGALAAGLHFIQFLEKNCYTGVDVSAKVLIEGEKRVKEKELDGKNPELLHLPSGDLDILEGKNFDFIWAQSVLTHMPPEAIEYLFYHIKYNMNSNSRFYANFKKSDKGVKQEKYRDWQYDSNSIIKIVESSGLNCQIMTDWFHPYDESHSDTMICVSLI